MLRIAIPDLVSPSYFPAIAAVELGFLAREGIEARIELVFPVTRTYEQLRDGAVDLVGGAAHAPLYAFPDWSGCRLVAALARNMYWFLVVRRDLGVRRGDLAALRGLRIGAAPGPVDGLKRMLRAAGVDPERDLNIGPVPGTAGAGVSFGVAAARALEQGLIDGFWANGMGAEVAIRSGAGSMVLDARRGDGPAGSTAYTFPALVATERRVKEDPRTIAAAVRALVAAQQALRADSGAATSAASRLFPAAETALIAGLVERDAPYYDAAIPAEAVDSLNRFARDMGLLRELPPYESVVAAEFGPLWGAAATPASRPANP